MTEEVHGQIFPAKRLEAFGASALAALGLSEQDAVLCAGRMIDADLRGVDTHGIFPWRRSSYPISGSLPQS